MKFLYGCWDNCLQKPRQYHHDPITVSSRSSLLKIQIHQQFFVRLLDSGYILQKIQYCPMHSVQAMSLAADATGPNETNFKGLEFRAFVGIVIFDSCFEKLDFLEKMELFNALIL